MGIFLRFTTNPPIPKKFYSYLDYICDTVDSAVPDGSALTRKYDMDTSPQIETLNLDIKMHSSSLQGTEAREKVDSIVDSSILPVLEKVCEEYGSLDADIDSIEMDLGKVSEKELPVFLEKELRNRLDRIIPNRTRNGDIESDGSRLSEEAPDAFLSLLADYLDDDAITIENELSHDTDSPSDLQKGVRPPEFSPQRIRTLLEYLTSLSLPWDMDISGAGAYKALKDALTPGTGRCIPDSIPVTDGFDAQALARMEMLLKEIIAEGNSEILTGEPDDNIGTDGSAGSTNVLRVLEDNISQKLGTSGGPSSEKLGKRLALWKKYLQANLSAETVSTRTAPTDEPVRRANHSTDAGLPFRRCYRNDGVPVTTELFTESDYDPGTEAAREEMSGLYPDRREEIHDPTFRGSENQASPASGEEFSGTSTGIRTMERADAADARRAVSDDAADKSAWLSTPEEEDPPGMKRTFISDAGLVLIHPFLTHFLRTLGLLDEHKSFVSEIARIHAVHLIRHIAGSDEPHLEHNLLLGKVLCGLPLNYVIPTGWKATRREEEETENMLKAAMAYWGPLAKSSTEALRRGFLQRAGSIERENDETIVRVEGSAMDILLEDLPWQISVIMLPWLDKPIFVEWQK